MYHYRQVLVRMRQGESDRQIAATGLMGRGAASKLRKLADPLGWLDSAHSLPSDEALAGVLQPPKSARAGDQSSVYRYRELIARWWSEGIDGTTIYAALQRNHDYQGSYSSLSRYLRILAAKTPCVTTVLEFAPGEAAQVDFGKGPEVVDVRTGEVFKTWVFVMVLAWSRHQYAGLVRNQRLKSGSRNDPALIGTIRMRTPHEVKHQTGSGNCVAFLGENCAGDSQRSRRVAPDDFRVASVLVLHG
jgi:hypothetical protein